MGQDKVYWYGLGFGTAESTKGNYYDAGQSPYHKKLKGDAHGIYMNISKDPYGLIGIIYG